MDIFLLLFTNLMPLYLIIAAGYFVGKWLRLDRETLANVAIYICVPIVAFGFIVDLDLQPAYLAVPVILYFIHCAVGFGFLRIGNKIYGDGRANLVSMCASMGNTGYFGLPLVILLFPKELVGIYMFMLLAGIIYEGSIGYYIAARGRFTVRDSLIKLAKFPSLYAVAAGLIANSMGAQMPEQFYVYWSYFKGAYVILGMMIIGAALSKVEKIVIGPRLAGLAFAGKFLAWPLLVSGAVALDWYFLHWLDSSIYKLMLVYSIVPPAANIAAFAAQMNLVPEKAATTVLLGTVFALFYIPLVLAVLGI
ncbi:MAG: AEC family transporter [Alphaproteobacteria bacterium]